MFLPSYLIEHSYNNYCRLYLHLTCCCSLWHNIFFTYIYMFICSCSQSFKYWCCQLAWVNFSATPSTDFAYCLLQVKLNSTTLTSLAAINLEKETTVCLVLVRPALVKVANNITLVPLNIILYTGQQSVEEYIICHTHPADNTKPLPQLKSVIWGYRNIVALSTSSSKPDWQKLMS